jgi:hypothetical protein
MTHRGRGSVAAQTMPAMLPAATNAAVETFASEPEQPDGDLLRNIRGQV